MRKLSVAALGLAALLGSNMVEIGNASAMPRNGLATKQISNGVQGVRWVCGPYRCWWTPRPYWGPRPFYGYGWGWHRWGWHRWGWHRHWG